MTRGPIFLDGLGNLADPAGDLVALEMKIAERRGVGGDGG